MGYVLSAYVVDGDAVVEAIGSGDRKLVDRIVQSNRAEFDDADEFPVGSSAPPLRIALERLIDGSPEVSDHAQYRYAMEEICRYVGKQAFADRYDFRSVGLEPLFEASWPFPVPNPGNFPHLAFLPPESIGPELARVESLEAATLAEAAREFAVVWAKCLKLAKRRASSVVLAYG